MDTSSLLAKADSSNSHGWTLPGEPHRFLFQTAVAFDDRDNCLDWPFAKKKEGGYGVIVINGKFCIVSRVVCEAVHGAPPHRSYEAAHSCGNARCCNPWHLSWKTRKDNEADKSIHGTAIKGSQIYGSKLTEAEARKIKELSGRVTDVHLAKIHGVCPSTIRQIRLGKNWAWL